MPSSYVEPTLRIWVSGRPQSFQKRGSLSSYTQRIRESASACAPAGPITSSRIDVEIWFVGRNVDRADVDNVIKPVLDALIGVIFVDDRQVRSVRAVAVPPDDFVGFGCTRDEVFARLREGEFLVNVFAGARLPRDGP